MPNLHKKANCKKNADRLISQQYTKTKKNAGQTKFKITKETKLSKSQSNLNLVTHCTAHKTNKIAKRNKIAACEITQTFTPTHVYTHDDLIYRHIICVSLSVNSHHSRAPVRK